MYEVRFGSRSARRWRTRASASSARRRATSTFAFCLDAMRTASPSVSRRYVESCAAAVDAAASDAAKAMRAKLERFISSFDGRLSGAVGLGRSLGRRAERVEIEFGDVGESCVVTAALEDRKTIPLVAPDAIHHKERHEHSCG